MLRRRPRVCQCVVLLPTVSNAGENRSWSPPGSSGLMGLRLADDTAHAAPGGHWLVVGHNENEARSRRRGRQSELVLG